MTADELRRLEYQGGGYFRLPGPAGEKRPIAHAPEVHAALVAALDRIAALEAAMAEK